LPCDPGSTPHFLSCVYLALDNSSYAYRVLQETMYQSLFDIYSLFGEGDHKDSKFGVITTLYEVPRTYSKV